MKKIEKVLVSIAVAVALLLSVTSSVIAVGFTNNDANQNPYVVAYLNELAQKGTPLAHVESDADETIASLNIYYQKDVELYTLIQEYAPADFDLSMICSIEKEDKISAMHMMQTVYNQIEDDECTNLVNDYFRRYATDSGDDRAIDFYNSIFVYSQSRKMILSEISANSNDAKQELEATLDNKSNNTRAISGYDDNFSPIKAGEWAYENYYKYNENFPAFNNGFGSDCMNFVSQALYFGGMEMHDTWYCHKKNNEYPRPSSAAELDYSWTLEDPSPWISVEQFVSFWSDKTDAFYEYKSSEYTENHSKIYVEPITKGDVIILCNKTLWWTTPKHAMIVSAYDTTNWDFLCAGHSNMRKDLPLVTAVSNYDVVRIYCF